jgi:predicted dehydrogenase
VRELRRRIANRELGEIRLIRGHYLQDWLTRDTDYNWRVDPAVSGQSRAVADIGTHLFDIAEFLTGLRVDQVFADLATLIPFRERPVTSSMAFAPTVGPRDRVRVESEDVAVVLLRFVGGARGALVVSQVQPGHKNDLTIEVAGSTKAGMWRHEDPENLWLSSLGHDRDTLPHPHDLAVPGIRELVPGHPEGLGSALRDLFRPFYAAVSSGAPPPDPATAPYPTLWDGVHPAESSAQRGVFP